MLFLSCFASILLVASKVRQIHSIHDEENKSTDSSLLNSQVISSSYCTSKSERSLLFVSTADGAFTCLNALTGSFLWSLPTSRSLISSSVSAVKSIQEFSETRLIPSLSGNLYKWNGETLETLPLSSDYLLGQIRKLPDGSYVVGGQEVVINGIDVTSGEVSYECSLTGCHPVEDSADDIKSKDILSLRRTQKTIRVLEPRTGREKWNFSVGNFEIELIEGENSEITLDCDSQTDNGNSINFVMQDGVVTSERIDHQWAFHFNSPIAGAWKLDDNKLKVLNTFSDELFDTSSDSNINMESLMYLGIYKGQMYVQQPFKSQRKEINTFSDHFLIEKMTFPQISQWRPLISTSPSRTPFLNNEKSTALSSLDYPFDNGFFLYTNTTSLALLTDDKDAGTCDSSNPDVCPDDNVDEKEEESTENVVGGYDFVPLTISDWLFEILGLSILIAVGINVSIRFIKRRWEIPAVEAPVNIVEAEEAVEELPEQISTTRVKANSVSITTSPIEEISNEETGSSTSTITSTSEYTSRYLVDFEHLQCLGKGGFGVVFKAKKKIDDCEYAIKRIYLPRCDEAKARMMREVRALAALEHPAIVRYFHAWWEEPPSGWQLETDRQFLMKDVIMETPSYALSDDWMIEIDDASPNNKMANNNKKLNDGVPSMNDPLGKRYNFDTGTEDFLNIQNGDFDLLRHNDVFYSDESAGDVSSNGNSFIVFEGDSNDCSSTSCSSSCSTDQRRQHLNTLTADQENSEESFVVFEHNGTNELTTEEKLPTFDDDITNETSFCSQNTTSERRKKRIVGKCCNRSSVCLKEPPLFLYIQMQLCKHQTLKDWLIERKSSICFSTSFKIFMQIVNAVEYFHCQGMMHRDLKPANIFFSLDGSIKVGDFGLVTAITRPSRGKHKKGFQDENHTGQVGTQLYMSPEQVSGKPYSQKVDLYALGLILFELISYFSTQMERMQLIYGIKRGDLPVNVAESPQGKLVKLLTSEDPSIRPEAKEIKTHPLMEEMKELFDVTEL